MWIERVCVTIETNVLCLSFVLCNQCVDRNRYLAIHNVYSSLHFNLITGILDNLLAVCGRTVRQFGLVSNGESVHWDCSHRSCPCICLCWALCIMCNTAVTSCVVESVSWQCDRQVAQNKFSTSAMLGSYAYLVASTE